MSTNRTTKSNVIKGSSPRATSTKSNYSLTATSPCHSESTASVSAYTGTGNPANDNGKEKSTPTPPILLKCHVCDGVRKTRVTGPAQKNMENKIIGLWKVQLVHTDYFNLQRCPSVRKTQTYRWLWSWLGKSLCQTTYFTKNDWDRGCHAEWCTLP